MNLKRIGFWGVAITLAGAPSLFAEHERRASRSSRSGYTYLRESSGEVTVFSRYNGRVAARRNLPITAGDEIRVSDGGRAEIALADGNLLHVGGGTRARFVSLSAQQGEKEEVSAIDLEEGSVILAAVGTDEDALPRIDTEDATVYLEPGARVRVNADRRRGTVVIARAGSVEVRTREDKRTLRSGQYMMVRGEEEPEIARGTFSRDRFDLWSAERLETLYETRSASARYVDDEYDSEVVALDGYGDWNYSSTYSTNVWTPRVSVGWTPYSYGCWYYTPAGLTWWSYDPWGWYPHHYGSWYFDTFRSRWCWVPSYVYSPAWVYWAYTPSYIGWCPIGYYSFYSPWYDNYYRRWGIHNRGGIYLSIHGTFSPRQVDFRGWNFSDTNGFGAGVARMEVIPGSRITGRLGPEVAISSRPIVVNARGGSPREALREYIREAPGVIERTEGPDSSRLAPILARDRTLPAATVDALRQRTVVADRGRLAGPRAADLAPPGAFIERGRTIGEIWAREDLPRSIGRARGIPGEREETQENPGEVLRGRPSEEREHVPVRPNEPRSGGAIIPPDREEGWRGRGRGVPRAEGSGREDAESLPEPRRGRGEARERIEGEPGPGEAPRARGEEPSSDWRGRGRLRPVPAREEAPTSSETEEHAPAEGWRSRPEVPPAVRVIEGAVPGRRAREPRSDPEPGSAPEPRSFERGDSYRNWEPRSVERFRDNPPPREHRSSPPREHRGSEGPRSREAAPAPRAIERAPAPPAHESHAPAPHVESREPAPHFESASEPDSPPPAPPVSEEPAPEHGGTH